jgi:hypothetical protein
VGRYARDRSGGNVRTAASDREGDESERPACNTTTHEELLGR